MAGEEENLPNPLRKWETCALSQTLPGPVPQVKWAGSIQIGGEVWCSGAQANRSLGVGTLYKGRLETCGEAIGCGQEEGK